jgi:hypothetical protein
MWLPRKRYQLLAIEEAESEGFFSVVMPQATVNKN